MDMLEKPNLAIQTQTGPYKNCWAQGRFTQHWGHVVLLVSLAISGGCVAAESSTTSLVLEGSVGKRVSPAPSPSLSEFPFVPLEQWPGTKFIFLPMSKKVQGYGYQSFHVPYENYVGRIATVVAVKSGSYPTVRLKMDDDGNELEATAYSENIDGIGPVVDIEQARTKWLGKTLWMKGDEVIYYDADADKFSSIAVPRFSPVVVKNVVAGWYNHKPVRLIIETSTGDQGFFDFNLSGTNVSMIFRSNPGIEKWFFESDPKKTYKWSKAAWNAVIARKVYVGMSAEQARLSWGEPDEINRTIVGRRENEQWVYGSGIYLYLENEKVTAIQN